MTISEKRSFEKDHCRDVHFVNEKSRAKIGTDGLLSSVPFFAKDRDPDQEHCQMT
jgi:hypothetical protein